MKYAVCVLAAAAICATTTLPALADAVPAKPAQCFSMIDFNNWKAPDARTIYIRVGLNRYYQLDLAGTCSQLKSPGAHLITKTRGSDRMCGGIDWELSVSDSIGFGDGGFRQACIVKTQTPLSDAEVAAIPKKFKP